MTSRKKVEGGLVIFVTLGIKMKLPSKSERGGGLMLGQIFVTSHMNDLL